MKINTQNKIIKKLLSAVLTASIIATSFASVVQASAQTTGEGSNQEGVVQTTASSAEPTKEFVINNKDDLSKFMNTSDYWESNYKITLAHDIDMEWATLNPIYKFDGVFDGCKHTISNLKVEATRKGIWGFDVAFINILSSSAEIKNVEFDNCDIIVNDKYVTYAAVLVVANHGNISGVCIKRARINGDNKNNKNVVGGGLVYINKYNGTIYNCDMGDYQNCHKFASSVCVNGDLVGGFAYFNDGIIDSCYSYTEVKGQGIAGGFVGINVKGTITNCAATGNASGQRGTAFITKENSGAFVGENEGSITNCTATGNTSSFNSGVFVGKNEGGITNCTATGNASGVNSGVFVGKNEGGITNCTATGNARGAHSGGFVGENEKGKITNCETTGGADSSSISNPVKVGGFAGVNKSEIKDCNAEGKATAKTKTHTALAGGFVGENEKGTIIGCTATGGADSSAKPVHARPVHTKAGGFAGVNKSEIKGCKAEGKATAKTEREFEIIYGFIREITLAGGFVGENEKGTITDCEATGGADSSAKVGQAKAGGFAGINKASIMNSKASGSVYLSSGKYRTDNGCGGFIGKNDQGGKIDGCYAECTVKTTNHNKGGGFVGEAENKSEIYNSSCKTKRVTKNIITKKEKTKKAGFCYDKSIRAKIKNCHAD